ncbi:hypothetical protein MTR_5g024977 [Medicago truncatula]|uniref:Uncharacterized protein n=1 Tax=Medicago truncatula TaxID=3880 RepID=A0A072UEV9_MEDTR|nr:hypothetical protein MTR_5g024977 [Medicago truncatula]
MPLNSNYCAAPDFNYLIMPKIIVQGHSSDIHSLINILKGLMAKIIVSDTRESGASFDKSVHSSNMTPLLAFRLHLLKI